MKSINRKQLFQTGGLAALGMAGLPLLAQEHHHHHHTRKYSQLASVAADCAKRGNDCVDHCLELLKSGDSSLARCAEVSQEMVIMCNALTAMASHESPYLKRLARVCIDVCRTCAKECRKHADKHPECKACLEGCEECIKECRKI